MDKSGSDQAMSVRQEAETVYRNQPGDHRHVAGYIVERCGDFTFDSERADFIAEFLRASALAGSEVGQGEGEKT